MDYYSVIVALVPALIVLAVTQYYLWRRADRDLLVVRYENAIKALYYEGLVAEHYYGMLEESENSSSTDLPINIDKIEKNNQILREKHIEIILILQYDDTLSTIGEQYSKARNKYLLRIVDMVSTVSTRNEENYSKLKALRSRFRTISNEYTIELQNRIKTNMNNPVSTPVAYIWSTFKRPFIYLLNQFRNIRN